MLINPTTLIYSFNEIYGIYGMYGTNINPINPINPTIYIEGGYIRTLLEKRAK
jgi:hypothetical protein